MDSDFERFTKSSSFAANGERKKSKRCAGTLSLAFTAILALMVCAGIYYVFHTDSRESFFDELVTTGGAVRSLQTKRTLSSGETYKQLICKTEDCHTVSQYVKSCMNEKVDPCEDFFNYACGGWIKKNPIPKTSSSFSTFSKLNQQIEKILRKILEMDGSADTKVLRKVKNFYKSCMNMNMINKRGDLPMKKLIEYLGSWPMTKNAQWNEEKWNLYDILLKIHHEFTSSGGPLFSLHVSDDPVHNEKHILEVRRLIFYAKIKGTCRLKGHMWNESRNHSLYLWHQI